MASPSLRENDEAIRKYIEATKTLLEASVANNVKKVVFTGSASSVIGQFPVKDPTFVYTDAYNWVDAKAINKPNEKAKILAEKVCWNAIKKQDQTLPDNAPRTNLISFLPYFMLGPPVYQDLINTNSSC